MSILTEAEVDPLTQLRSCALDLHSLAFLDAKRLSLVRAHGAQTCQHMLCMVARSMFRRKPLGPPDTWLARSPIAAEFAIEGRVKHCRSLDAPAPYPCCTTGPSATFSMTLVRREGLMARVRWGRIADAIRLVILRKIPGDVDTSTIYTPIGADGDIEFYVEGTYSQDETQVRQSCSSSKLPSC